MLVRYRHPLYKTDLGVAVESAEQPLAGWSADGVVDSVQSVAGGIELREAAVGVVGKHRQFLRFRITLGGS